MPAPFLRRCLYFYLRFPNTATELQAIVSKHYEVKQEIAPEEDLVQAATERFIKVREDAGLFKLPGTSELLDWLKALHSFDETDFVEQLTNEKNEKYIPYRELLFKLRQDWQKHSGFAS